MAKKTKIDRVLNRLLSGHFITSWGAITLFRATRLSDIIFTLRKRGYIIATITVKNKEGYHAKYKLYDFLTKKDIKNPVDFGGLVSKKESKKFIDAVKNF